MPLNRLIADDHIATKIAKVMHDAYEAVLLHIVQNKITGASSERIARRIFDAVAAGEHDAAKIAESIIKTLRPA